MFVWQETLFHGQQKMLIHEHILLGIIHSHLICLQSLRNTTDPLGVQHCFSQSQGMEGCSPGIHIVVGSPSETWAGLDDCQDQWPSTPPHTDMHWHPHLPQTCYLTEQYTAQRTVSNNIGSNHRDLILVGWKCLHRSMLIFFFLKSVSQYFSSSSNLQAAPLAPFFPHACYATSLTLPLFPCTLARLSASPLPPGCW